MAKLSLKRNVMAAWTFATPTRAGWKGKEIRTVRRHESYPGEGNNLSGGSQRFVKFLSRSGGVKVSVWKRGSAPLGRGGAPSPQNATAKLLRGFEQALFGFFLAFDAMAGPRHS